jgi:cardiolipin synthase A/B
MQPLLDAVVDLAALVSPAKIRTLASALRGLAAPSAAPNAKALADTPAARAAVTRVLAAWRQERASGDELAGMLLGASEARLRVERELSVELVWTGPTTRFVPTRRTEQVLLDLIASATTELFLVSFVAYEVRSVVMAMKQAANRGVRLRVLLEASTSHGGTLNYDPAATMRASVPAAELFEWRKKPEPFVDGKVHAKVAVVDCERAFITSANLTGHALEKNMEAGVLINGGPTPKVLADHLQALIDVGVLGSTWTRTRLGSG